MNKRALFTVAFFSISLTASFAQGGVFSSHDHPMASLPRQAQGLSIVDSDLYVYASEVLLKAIRQDDEIVGYLPDTFFVKNNESVNYVVQHPSTGDIYFTSLNRKGRSCLYCCHNDGKRTKTKRIKMDDIEVEHPTFSADGSVMVFSSIERRRSYGGYDLWYSILKDGEWGLPVNMGNRVNSSGDDVTPCIVGDYLFFSSNGRDENRNHLNIYVTRLIAQQVTGDTIGMLQIGRSRVQPLPQGINSATSDCFNFVVGTNDSCCYWVNSSSGIRSYSGPLEAVMLWGHTYDGENTPLSGVRVTAYNGNQVVAITASTADGFYRLTLPVGTAYQLVYSCPMRFSQKREIVTQIDPAGNLVGEVQRDVVLDSLPVGRPIYYGDLFGPDAVVDLSVSGKKVLAPLILFLSDNPGLQADLTLYCDLTANAEFNALLVEQRMLRLNEYMVHKLCESMQVQSTDVAPRLQLHNGCRTGVNRDGGYSEGCSNASGDVHLTVVLQ